MYIQTSVLITASILLTVLIVFLICYKRKEKNEEIEKAKQELEKIKKEIQNSQEDIAYLNKQESAAAEGLCRVKKELEQTAREGYKKVEQELSTLKEQREQELEKDFIKRKNDKQALFDSELQKTIAYYDSENNKIRDIFNQNFESYQQKLEQIQQECDYQQQKYECLLEPIRQYEKEKQAKEYYTIQVPVEYREDIEYLLTEIAQKIQHPDILNKLIWTEYIKPYTDELFKRIGIKDEPGIYKLTNINDNKSYIGKSTNVKKRITDHIKGSLQISTIADQYVHHEMRKTGLWNWTIECITYCEKDKLSELEKYYINFFKTQEWGFNKKEGG